MLLVTRIGNQPAPYRGLSGPQGPKCRKNLECLTGPVAWDPEKVSEQSGDSPKTLHTGEIKVSTSTVAALFSKMALTGQRIAMVDMVLLFFQLFHIYRRGGWSQSFPLKIFFSCSLGGGGRYFSVPCHTLSGDSPETSQTVPETFWRLLWGPRPETPRDIFETSAFRA